MAPGRQHGGRGFAGASGLGADRALAASHVREGAGAGKGVPGAAGLGCGTAQRYGGLWGVARGAGPGGGPWGPSVLSRRRWGTNRCRPPWAGTSSAARSTSSQASSPTVSAAAQPVQARWAHGGALTPPVSPPAKHIVKVDGRAGLFKGLAPRLCSSAIGTVVHGKVLQVPCPLRAFVCSCRWVTPDRVLLSTAVPGGREG